MDGTITRSPDTTRAEPGLDARLAAAEAAMTVRLETAALAVDINTAHVATEPLDLAAVVTGPVPLPEPPEPDYPTPMAALLQRAARRLTHGGWCRGATVDEDGARCLYGAIRAENPGGAHTDDALAVLLDAIRRRFPGAETIPSANDHFVPDSAAAVRLLDDAARLADTRGL